MPVELLDQPETPSTQWTPSRLCVALQGVSWSTTSSTGESSIAEFPLLNALQDPGQQQQAIVESVKSGKHREVLMLQSEMGNYYLKRRQCRTVFERLKLKAGQSQFTREWKSWQQCKARQIPTIDLLALGKNEHGEEWLISAAMKHLKAANDLIDFLPSQPVSSQQHILSSLAQFIESMHSQGVLHQDFHSRNLHARVENDQQWHWLLVDMHPIHFGKSAHTHQRLKHLAMFHHDFAQAFTTDQKLRFLNSYFQSWAKRNPAISSASFQSHFISQLQQQCRAYSSEAYNRSDRKWLRGNRHVTVKNSPEAEIRYLNRLPLKMQQRMTSRLPELMTQNSPKESIKSGSENSVFLTSFSFSGPEMDCVVKQRSVLYWLDWLHQWGRHRSLKQAWNFGHAMRRRGISTPQPLAYFRLTPKKRSYFQEVLITERLAKAPSAMHVIHNSLTKMNSRQRDEFYKSYSHQMAIELQKLHQYRFDHRDLKPANWLIGGTVDQPQVWILDLDAVERWTYLPSTRKIRNLLRIVRAFQDLPEMRSTHLLRFLKSYLGERRKHRLRAYWRRLNRNRKHLSPKTLSAKTSLTNSTSTNSADQQQRPHSTAKAA